MCIRILNSYEIIFIFFNLVLGKFTFLSKYMFFSEKKAIYTVIHIKKNVSPQSELIWILL